MANARIMVTNDGPHSPEKWAVVTGEHIFPIDPNVDGDRLMVAKKVQIKIIEALEPHHTANMHDERGKLSANGDAHYDTPLTPEAKADEALSAVCGVLAGTPWEDKAKDQKWLAVIRQELCTHFATVQHIERQWHARRNPQHVRGQEFLVSLNAK